MKNNENQPTPTNLCYRIMLFFNKEITSAANIRFQSGTTCRYVRAPLESRFGKRDWAPVVYRTRLNRWNLRSVTCGFSPWLSLSFPAPCPRQFSASFRRSGYYAGHSAQFLACWESAVGPKNRRLGQFLSEHDAAWTRRAGELDFPGTTTKMQ